MPVLQVALQERTLERVHEQILDVPVPRKIKESVEPGSRDSAVCGDATTGSSASNCGKNWGFPVDQPGDQACLFSADSVHRQDCRYACVMQRMVPRIQTSWKTVEVPPAWFGGRVMEAPVIMQMRRWSLRQCRRFWKSQSFLSFTSKLLRRHSSFHTNAFQSALSRWMMSTRFRDDGREAEEEEREEGCLSMPHRGLP